MRKFDFDDIIDFLMKIAFVLAAITCFIGALAYFVAMIYCLKGGCLSC